MMPMGNNNTKKKELSTNQAASVYTMQTKTNLVTCLHLAMWIPVVDTWIKAIDNGYLTIYNGYLTIFPGLDTATVQKHLPKPTATSKGHMCKLEKTCSAPSLP